MSAFEAIDKITYNIARAPLDTEQTQLLFLKSWWSRTYSRPLKDPLLQEYTLEELYYEYRDYVEREAASQERAEDAADNIEQKKLDEVDAWAREEEERELKELEQKGQSDISEQDQKWMQEQIDQAKEVYGQDFGEDLEVNFDE